jgi:hypothetical protein
MAEENKTTAKAVKNDYIKIEPKNVRQKLQEARMLLKEEKMNKSGTNSFLKSKYYTLADIQTPITKVCTRVGICPLITFTNDVATMTIYDCDSDETIQITSPMVELKKEEKKSLMQELGGMETYQRRFLMLVVFEIIEEEQEETDDLEKHDILMVKTRIEREMTELLKLGYSVDEIYKNIGVGDEKKFNGYMGVFATINTIENNMRFLLNDKKQR